MARNRAWRRAQRSRLIQRRRQRAFDLWSWSVYTRPEWIEERARGWSKVDPFTQCSCWMCRNKYDPKPIVDWRREMDDEGDVTDSDWCPLCQSHGNVHDPAKHDLEIPVGPDDEEPEGVLWGGHAVGWGDAITHEEADLLNKLEVDGAITVHDKTLKRALNWMGVQRQKLAELSRASEELEGGYK